MWTLLIGSLVAGAIAAGTSIYVAHKNKQAQDEANKANKEINEANNAFNAEQASISRDYNSEQAQVDRTFSAEQADVNRQFQASEAQKQRDYESHMSNTAIQRRVADLQAAGFNPALAVTSASASTPGAVAATGSMAQGSRASAGSAQSSGNAVMRAVDYSPYQEVARNLSSMVSSASSIVALKTILKDNPDIAKSMSIMSKGLVKSVTSASKMDKLSSII